MKIHEYQAKTILAKYKVPVPRGEVAFSVAEAETAAKNIGGRGVVKAQNPWGGGGKGGGGQGGRRQGGEGCRRSRGGRREDARNDPRHPPDGSGRPDCAAVAGGGDAADRARTLPRHCPRPYCWKAGVHGFGRGR